MSAPQPLRAALVGACPYPVPQGSQVYMANTALALRTRGVEPHLVVYGYGALPLSNGLSVHRSQYTFGAGKTSAGPFLRKPLLDLATAATLRRVVREQKIQIVDAHNYEGLLVALAVGKRPIIYHAHNVMADELPYYFKARRAAETLGRGLDRALPKRADYVIAAHEPMAAYLVSCGCSPDRIAVVPPPLDGSPFRRPGAGPGRPSVLYAGNVDAYQNLDFLFRMMEGVHESEPRAELHIATAAPEAVLRKRMPEALPDYVRIVPTPDFDALLGVLNTDAVFVCPRVSWSGYPIKLLNAMAAGMAIVCSTSAAHPLTDGVNGRVVADGDEGAFGETVLSLMGDGEERRRLGGNAQDAIAETHSPERAGRILDRLFRELI